MTEKAKLEVEEKESNSERTETRITAGNLA